MSEINLQRRISVVSLGFMLTVLYGLEVALTSDLLICMCYKYNLSLDQRFQFGEMAFVQLQDKLLCLNA